MPAKSKPSYTRYLVDVNQSSHSETLYLDDDSHSRESHAMAAPRIIPVLPPPMVPNLDPQRPRAGAHSVSSAPEDSQPGESIIESFGEPAPEDEINSMENVRQIEIYLQGI
ncbi:hypothetical protein FRC01_001225 [Tulasnella sp. 417]|nr:hypothetical protein FRC01_001225 [Tulasnella sp. 417]